MGMFSSLKLEWDDIKHESFATVFLDISDAFGALSQSVMINDFEEILSQVAQAKIQHPFANVYIQQKVLSNGKVKVCYA